jgi:formate hydrogenlyase transcriptional activator
MGTLAPGPELPLAARYETLVRLSQAIRVHRDPQELFHALADKLRQVIDFDSIGVVQYSDESRDGTGRVRWHVLEFRDHSHAAPPLDASAEESAAVWVFQNQRPLIISDVDELAGFPVTAQFFRSHGIHSLCLLPLTTVHRPLGILGFGREQRAAFSEQDEKFLSLVADVVAVAIDDALNFDASRQAQRRLRLLLDLTNRVVANLDLRDVLREISHNVREVMHSDLGGVSLLDEESGGLRVFALDFPGSTGYTQEDRIVPVADREAVQRLVRNRVPVYGSRKELAAKGLSEEALEREGLNFLCALPLISRDRVLGSLAVGRRDQRPFTHDDVDFLTQVASQVAIAIENALAYGRVADLNDQLAQEKLYLEDEIRSQMNFEEIIGQSSTLRRVLAQVETVAPTESTVLIYGETGTGKELIARAVHNLSARRAGAFVKLNCAAIPTGLLESEMFGHEKGAFTGAIMQRIGRFELAHHGTVFLDEIGEIPLEVQPKLLRVLQEREFERLGSTRTLRTDARLIAATNRDLETMVAEGRFRSDLFYRLNVFPIVAPPLRERSEDIPVLVRHFVQQFSRRMNKTIETIPTETMNALTRYHWPGNIRELQNVIERAVIVSAGKSLRVPLSELKSAAPAHKAARSTPPMREMLEQAEREQILKALEESNWIVAGPAGAAARLGMKRSTLQFRMGKLGIRISRMLG